MATNLLKRLRACPARSDLVHHRFFREVVNDVAVTREATAVVLGQWWHPLHYFPTFLSRSIAVFDDLNHKTFVADILNEELGDGDPTLAHERIYISTMKTVGFTEAEVTAAEPLPATVRLIDSYRTGSEARLSALGCAFATEVADLAMVGGIGKLVRRTTGVAVLPWVDIHIDQEPNHVDKVSLSLGGDFPETEIDLILQAADHHWRDWCGFFDALTEKVLAPPLAMAS